MSGGIEIDVAALRAAAGTLQGTGQQLGGEVADLESTVTGVGHPWGSDEAGSLFAAVYVEVLTHALDVYRSMADQVLEAADNVRHGADAYEATESTNAELFRRMELPGGYAAAS